MMQLGVVFPQRDIGTDPEALGYYAQAVESFGYRHLLAYEHVVGADGPAHRSAGPHDAGAEYHEPFVLFGFLAALTRLELVTAVVVLPQRQTVLVAKQAAEVDVLTGGRLRLGVGVGWNRIEYDALGMPFGDRGRRIEAQIQQLRELWSQDFVDLDRVGGKRVKVGISPRPVQRPIPVWLGGSSDRTYERIGRLANGWFPQLQPGPELRAAQERVARAAEEAGRDAATIGLEGRVFWRGSPARCVDQIRSWEDAGATHVSVDLMGHGFDAWEQLDALEEIASQVGLTAGPGRQPLSWSPPATFSEEDRLPVERGPGACPPEAGAQVGRRHHHASTCRP